MRVSCTIVVSQWRNYTDTIPHHQRLMHTHHILFIAILSALLSLVALSPSKAFAQDSIDELVTNKNADGYKRSSKTGRVFAELGMGTVGLVTAAAPSALVFLGSAIFSVMPV